MIGRAGVRLAAMALALTTLVELDAKVKAPDWLAAAAAAENPEFQKNDRPDVVVLWDEGVYKIDEYGKLSRTVRYALRIIEPNGKKRANVYAHYRDGSSSVSSIKAWSIDSEGEVYAFKKNEVEDFATTGYALYTESRAKRIRGESRSRVGHVFGYEYTVEERSIFSQHRWYFQSSVPVLASRLDVIVPEGWSVEANRFHGAPAAEIERNRYRWEMRDRPRIKSEKNAPYRSVARSFITVDIRPPEGMRSKHTNLRFESWRDVADYTAEIQDPQATASPEIIAKAKELAAGSDDIWGKVQSIGDYVKSLQYASINFNLSQGGGYIPRPAAEVFKVGYGDCKDKANLLRSMLGVVGIDAYPVVVNATNNDRVYPEWPSTYYFNHCISAVEVDESVDTHAVVEDPNLGRILFVDATSELTPIGELPFDEQGGLTVVGKRGQESLVRLPLAPPEANLSSRTMEAEVFPNGAILGVVKDAYHGKRAYDERVRRLRNDEKEYKAVYERWIGKGNAGAVVQLNSVADREDEDRAFKVDFEFAIPRYAQNMRNQLLIFKPAILTRQEESPYAKPSRTQPLRMEPRLFEEEAIIYLPVGFVVDDMKEEISVDAGFASYSATLAQVEDKLVFKRSLKFEDAIVPADSYKEVQAFYRAIIEADQTPVVLARAGE